MHPECGVAFAKLRTCRRIRPGQHVPTSDSCNAAKIGASLDHLIDAVERRVPWLVELDVSFDYVPLEESLSNGVIKATLRSKPAQRSCKIVDFNLRIAPKLQNYQIVSWTAPGGCKMRTHLLATTAAAALLAATSAQASRIFQEQPCRRTNGSRSFGLPLPKRPRLRAALNLAARIAIPVIVLNGVSGVAFAQNAIWNGPGADWNTAANWLVTVPGPNGTAQFTGTFPKVISTAGVVEVGALQFLAPNYIFINDAGAIRINGTGVDASLANAPTFNVVSTVGATPAIDFNNSSSAGTAKSFLAK
jgi:hypothetical protein